MTVVGSLFSSLYADRLLERLGAVPGGPDAAVHEAFGEDAVPGAAGRLATANPSA